MMGFFMLTKHDGSTERVELDDIISTDDDSVTYKTGNFEYQVYLDRDAIKKIQDHLIVEKFLKDRPTIPTPHQWLKDKLNITAGSTYIEPRISVTQAAAWITEYVKLFIKPTS